MANRQSWLVLNDGTVFEGYAIGADLESGVTQGEFVFNTALSGYQEVITDPSYAGQIIAFTYPHIGNYGTTALDEESRRVWSNGIVVRELSTRESNWRSERSLQQALQAWNIAGIAGVDTRRLTRHLRSHGALPGAFGHHSLEAVRAAAMTAVGTDATDFVSRVTTSEIYHRGSDGLHIVAFDYGIKETMVQQLAARFRVTIVPSSTDAQTVLEMAPDGVFLSNGPGDPAALGENVQVVSDLVGRLPIFGICLGHQLLATALGATTYKLPFGHHGSNHPVKDLRTNTIEITSQNHNYAVTPDSLRRAEVSHINLNDGVIEGIASASERCFSVQYHPEAGPGPHDARYLFDRFEDLLSTGKLVK